MQCFNQGSLKSYRAGICMPSADKTRFQAQHGNRIVLLYHMTGRIIRSSAARTGSSITNSSLRLMLSR